MIIFFSPELFLLKCIQVDYDKIDSYFIKLHYKYKYKQLKNTTPMKHKNIQTVPSISVIFYIDKNFCRLAPVMSPDRQPEVT